MSVSNVGAARRFELERRQSALLLVRERRGGGSGGGGGGGGEGKRGCSREMKAEGRLQSLNVDIRGQDCRVGG
jgi:hypothetical protein